MTTAVLKTAQTAAENAVYRALNPKQKEIRVLHVSGSANKEDMLDCTLHTVSLESTPKPKYEAISYCWGELRGYGQIRLHGSVVDAPASAIRALRQYRRREGPRVLWIDAICINQEDLEERAQQVSLMEHVYRNTLACLIWLGEASPETSDAIRSVEYISNNLFEQVFPENSAANKKFGSDFTYENLSLHALFSDSCTPRDLVTLFKRPWFTRVWVLQEAVLSPKATCHWGDWKLSWYHVYRTGRWCLEERRRGRNNVMGIIDLSDCYSGLMFAATAWLYAAARHIDALEWLSLADTMNYCTSLEALDNRDRLYAILGLFTYHVRRSAYLEWLTVDYTRSELEVFCDATRAAIIQRPSLEILEYVDLGFVNHEDLELPDFCSWTFQLLRRMRHTIVRRKLRDRGMCADRPMNLDLLIPSLNGDELLLNGYYISRVSTILTRTTLDMHDTGEGLGNMINHATEHLKATNCSHLVPSMMIAITQSNDNLSETLSEAGWIDFANVFAEFCRYHQTISESSETPAHELKGTLEPLFDSAINVCRGRRLFLTSDGRIGLGHENLHEDDYITALFGGKYPVILRPTIDGSPTNESSKADTQAMYRFVGLADIPGIMQGEAIEAYEQAGIEPQTFCLR